MAGNWDQHRTPVSHDGAGPSRLNPDFSNNLFQGLRVLVYAQNREHLSNYVTCLASNHYELKIFFSEEETMNQLCRHRNMFDIALIEVDKPEGYIFESINRTIDRPIIIISKDASKASVMKWLSKGAWDCLIEPSENDLKYIFKHVVTMEERRSMVAGEKFAREKSSSLEPNYNGDHFFQASTSKKKRLVWDLELNKKFMDAVNHFGIDKVNPKEILAHMKEPNLTRDHVASHLQKIRLKEKERMKLLEISITSSSRHHHHGEVSFASLMPHQPISEQQNIINSNIPMLDPIPLSYQGEASVVSVMTHRQYQTTNFSTQPNSNYYSGRTNFRFTNMYDEMGCANGGFGYETDPQLYNTCNVMDPETACPQVQLLSCSVDEGNVNDPETACPQVQLLSCNLDEGNVNDPETGSEFINNTSYRDENNN